MNSFRRICTGGIAAVTLATVSACSSGSGGSGGSDRDPPPDTTAPTVSQVQASATGDLNRTVSLSATASDSGGVAELRFFVDGVLLAADTTSPYSVAWDTSTVADGEHTLTAEAQDTAGNVRLSTAVAVTVRNTLAFSVTASGFEEVVPVDSAGGAQAELSVNLATGAVSGTLTITGIAATAAHIHNAFAGTNGSVAVAFEQDAGNADLFALPAGATLEAAEVDRLLAGALYVNVHSAAWPGGELRGQILPDGFSLYFTELGGDDAIPNVDTLASGRAAVTVDQVSGTLVVQARVTGLDDATQAHVHEAYAGNRGPVSVALARDAVDSGRWYVEGASLNAAALDALFAGRLYVNVHSPANPGGEIRGQIVPDGIRLFVVHLRGDLEVPAVDTTADGHAWLTLDETFSTVSIHVNTRRLADANGSHLHGAYGGISGTVEIVLNPDGSDPSHWFAEGQSLSPDQLAALLAGATYVNVHSPAHPAGEIRGQVIPDGILFASGSLEGRQEVPRVTTAAGGTFAVTVDPDALKMVVHANTTDAGTATAAHVHNAFAGSSGSVVVPLVQDGSEPSRWSAVDVDITADQLAALRSGRYYVNVHTPANTSGEIRGQIAPQPVEVLFTELSGSQEVPANGSAASGLAASTVNRESGSLTLYLRASGVDDATGGHVHMAFAGQNGPVLVPLVKDAANPGRWSATGATLDADGLAAYIEGRAYVNLHTPALPGGEIRGQLVPENIRVLLSPMDGDQVVPPAVTAAAGMVTTTVDLGSRSLAAFVNATGVDDATSAGVHVGGADTTGAEVLPLVQTQPGRWSAMTEPLDADSLAAYRAGRLYAQVATPDFTGGEIRGQIVPPDAALFDDQAPAVSVTAPAGGATLSDTVSITADASDDQGVTVVRFFAGATLLGSDTAPPYSLDWDTTGFADGNVALSAEADDEAGNTGVSAAVNVTVQNGSPVTLSQIQNEVFGPVCSGCHGGPTGSSLPSGMNLSSAASSYAALVNVNSLQRPALKRVAPGNPDNSYLVHKLDGAATIAGSRMPQGGPYLDAETMTMIRQWISAGALNN